MDDIHYQLGTAIQEKSIRENNRPRFGTNNKAMTSQEEEVAMAAVLKEKDGSEVHD